MKVIYGTVTIGDDNDTGDCVVQGKPRFTGTRQTLQIAMNFFMRADTEASWWTTYGGYITNLEKPGQRLRIYTTGVLRLDFDPQPTSGSPLGVVLDPEVLILGSDSDGGYSKSLQVTFNINLTSVVANGIKNASFSGGISPVGQKVVQITGDIPKQDATDDTSALSAVKDNWKNFADVVLATFGTASKFSLVNVTTVSNDPNMPTSGHKLNWMNVTATYKQVFYSEETDSAVSPTIVESVLTITPERFIDFQYTPASEDTEAVIRNRLRAEFVCFVRIYSAAAGGSGDPFDFNEDQEISEVLLADVFDSICKPRIEQAVAGQNASAENLIDAEVKYFPTNAQITAALVYDTDPGLISYAESVEIQQVSGYPYKLVDGEDDSHYIDRPGTTTMVTVSTDQEAFRGYTRGGQYTPSNGKILDSYVGTVAGTSRAKEIVNGFPVYETTIVRKTKTTYLINKADLTGGSFESGGGIDFGLETESFFFSGDTELFEGI